MYGGKDKRDSSEMAHLITSVNATPQARLGPVGQSLRGSLTYKRYAALAPNLHPTSKTEDCRKEQSQQFPTTGVAHEWAARILFYRT